MARLAPLALIPAALIGAAMLAACGGSATAASHRIAERPVVFDKRLVDVGGYRLFLQCVGHGSPALVFEGGYVPTRESADYSIVMRTMARADFTRVCSYDRAGRGRSEERRKRRVDALDLVHELHQLLHAAGIEPPYVLAGGSFGGLLVRVYRAAYPKEVSGMMLIDSQQEDDPELSLGPTWLLEGGSRLNMPRTLAEVRAAGSLGRLPLVVITAGQSATNPTWMEEQGILARLSTNSVHFVAKGAWHGVTDQVPRLVTEAARELVEAARAGAALPACGPKLERLGARCLGG